MLNDTKGVVHGCGESGHEVDSLFLYSVTLSISESGAWVDMW